MFGFDGLFKDEETLVFWVFILSSVLVFASGGSYGSSMVFAGLGLVALVPLAVLKAVASNFPILLPACALLFIFFLGGLKKLFGQAIFALIAVSLIVILVA